MKVLHLEIKRCTDCPYQGYDDERARYWCSRIGDWIDKINIPDWCPLPNKEGG